MTRVERRRRICLAAAGLITVSCLLWMIVNSRPLHRESRVAGDSTPTIETSPTPAPSAPSAISRQTAGDKSQSRDPRWKERDIKRAIDRNFEWKMPINFYGRVVDQNEQPVAGANVEFSWTDLSQAGSSQAHTTTDGQGFFTLLNQTGRHLEVRVSKEGFYTPKRQQSSFDYAAFWEPNYHEASPDRPVVFHLRKKNAGVRLVNGEVRRNLPPDGTPIRLDLLNGGRVSAAGQLEIAGVTNTEKYPPRIFDWWAAISVPGGGLLEYDDEFPFEAPEAGYIDRIEFNMPATAPQWKRVVEKKYFIRFGSAPLYGRIQVRLNGGSQKPTVEFVVNPSGSRNLEPMETEPAAPR